MGTNMGVEDADHITFEEEDADDEVGMQDFEDMPNDDKEVEEPKTGMAFDSDCEAYNYYKKYGKDKGFGDIRKKYKV